MMIPSSEDEEIGTDSSPLMVDKKAAKTGGGGSKMGRVAPLSIIFLTMFSGLAVYSHSNRLGKVGRKLKGTETAAGDLSLVQNYVNDMEGRRLDNDTENPSLASRVSSRCSQDVTYQY